MKIESEIVLHLPFHSQDPSISHKFIIISALIILYASLN